MDIIKFLLPYFAIAVALGIIGRILNSLIKSKKPSAKSANVRYRKVKSITTDRELKFYKSLKPIADAKRLVLFSKVRLADIIEPCANEKSSEFQSSFNRIKAKHIDFVLCDSMSLAPLLAIELDDSTHERNDRKQRDNFVDESMKSAGLSIIHTNDAVNLADKISKALETNNKLSK